MLACAFYLIYLPSALFLLFITASLRLHFTFPYLSAFCCLMLYSFIFSSPSLSYSQTCIFLSISSPSCVNTVSLRNASLPKQERNFLHSEPAPGILSLCLYRWQPPVVCLFNVFTELPVAIYPVAFPCQSNGVQVNRHSRCSMAERPICSERYTGQKAFTVDDKGERLNYCRGTA